VELAFTKLWEKVSARANNIKEATQLIENGFQYVKEMNDIKLFRKRA
jgi:hypothetical protein